MGHTCCKWVVDCYTVLVCQEGCARRLWNSLKWITIFSWAQMWYCMSNVGHGYVITCTVFCGKQLPKHVQGPSDIHSLKIKSVLVPLFECIFGHGAGFQICIIEVSKSWLSYSEWYVIFIWEKYKNENLSIEQTIGHVTLVANTGTTVQVFYL